MTVGSPLPPRVYISKQFESHLSLTQQPILKSSQVIMNSQVKSSEELVKCLESKALPTVIFDLIMWYWRQIYLQEKAKQYKEEVRTSQIVTVHRLNRPPKQFHLDRGILPPIALRFILSRETFGTFVYGGPHVHKGYCFWRVDYPRALYVGWHFKTHNVIRVSSSNFIYPEMRGLESQQAAVDALKSMRRGAVKRARQDEQDERPRKRRRLNDE